MIGVIAAGTPSVTTSARSVVNTRKLKVIDMKQTVEEAARENILFNHRTVDSFNPHTHVGCDYHRLA